MRGMLCFTGGKADAAGISANRRNRAPAGIRGEVKLRAMTEDMSRYARLESVFLKRTGRWKKKGAQGRSYDGFAFCSRGVNDRDASEALRGRRIYVDRRHAIKLGADENFSAN